MSRRIRSWWNSLRSIPTTRSISSCSRRRLGDEQETVRALQLGTLQMSMLATNNYAPFAPSCGWVNMPYLFDTLDEFRAPLDAMWEQNNEWAVRKAAVVSCPSSTSATARPPAPSTRPQARRRQGPSRSARRRTRSWCPRSRLLGLEPTAVSFSETFNAPSRAWWTVRKAASTTW